MSYLALILAFLKVLPQLLGLVSQFMNWLMHELGKDNQGKVKQISDAFSKLNSAQSQQERTDAAKAIADAIAGSL